MKKICGAFARSTGKPCQCKALANGRCRFHGGLSTGPTTPEGRRQSAENLRRARAALSSNAHAETRRQAAIKGWKTRRMRECYRHYGLAPPPIRRVRR